MDNRNSRYNFPKSQVSTELDAWDSFVIVGTKNGQPHLIANGDERTAQDLLKRVGQLEPATG